MTVELENWRMDANTHKEKFDIDAIYYYFFYEDCRDGNRITIHCLRYYYTALKMYVFTLV